MNQLTNPPAKGEGILEMKESYFKTVDYSVKARCSVCKIDYHDLVTLDFGEWYSGGKRCTRESLPLEEQINKRYKCCGKLVIYYSKMVNPEDSNE